MTCQKETECARSKECPIKDDWDVAKCSAFKRKPQEMTNEEYLRNCSTEELAELLNKIFMTKSFCHICPENNVCDIGYECKYNGGKVNDFVEMLKEKHNEC